MLSSPHTRPCTSTHPVHNYGHLLLPGCRSKHPNRKCRTRECLPVTYAPCIASQVEGSSSSPFVTPQNLTDTAKQSASLPSTQAEARIPKRIAIFVEPSPFTYVSGYKNRFTTMIKYLVEAGCEVLVITTGKGFSMPFVDTSGFVEQPTQYCGARVVSALSFGCPWYWQVPLSFALSPRIYNELRDFKPDLIHCSSPGVMVLAVKLYAWMLKLPLVLSYHTHVPSYLPKYGQSYLVKPFWMFLRLLHSTASLTLVTSPNMKDELLQGKAVDNDSQVQVWKKGVDSEAFHPRFKSYNMKKRLTNGKPDKVCLVYVGRLGFEKNLRFLKDILNRVPNVCLAFVGDGPARQDLQDHFRGTDTTFLGMLHGEDLSAAYASADIFVMPSESETLGFVVLEAMASQLPVVAVRAGGIPDIITKNGETGFLYQPGDAEQAAEMVRKLAGDAELRDKVGVMAREEVAKWDWKAATLYLLQVQYPLAVAAAAARFGPKLGSIAKQAWQQSQQQLNAISAATA